VVVRRPNKKRLTVRFDASTKDAISPAPGESYTQRHRRAKAAARASRGSRNSYNGKSDYENDWVSEFRDRIKDKMVYTGGGGPGQVDDVTSQLRYRDGRFDDATSRDYENSDDYENGAVKCPAGQLPGYSSDGRAANRQTHDNLPEISLLALPHEEWGGVSGERRRGVHGDGVANPVRAQTSLVPSVHAPSVLAPTRNAAPPDDTDVSSDDGEGRPPVNARSSEHDWDRCSTCSESSNDSWTEEFYRKRASRLEYVDLDVGRRGDTAGGHNPRQWTSTLPVGTSNQFANTSQWMAQAKSKKGKKKKWYGKKHCTVS